MKWNNRWPVRLRIGPPTRLWKRWPAIVAGWASMSHRWSATRTQTRPTCLGVDQIRYVFVIIVSFGIFDSWWKFSSSFSDKQNFKDSMGLMSLDTRGLDLPKLPGLDSPTVKCGFYGWFDDFVSQCVFVLFFLISHFIWLKLCLSFAMCSFIHSFANYIIYHVHLWSLVGVWTPPCDFSPLLTPFPICHVLFWASCVQYVFGISFEFVIADYFDYGWWQQLSPLPH